VSPGARWAAAAGLYAALTAAYAWPLLPVIGSALPNDIGDPGLNTWILWWNAQAAPLTSRWWNAPIFHPAPGALALSETFLNLWPIATPLQWAGASAVVTYNLMYLLSFPAAALAAHALARRLTGRHDLALVAGLAFGFAPYRAAHIPQLQVLWSCWMPLGLLALHRFLEGRQRRDLVFFAVCWVMNGLATGYYLFFFSVLVGVWLVWFARTLRDWVAIGAAATIGTLALAPLLIGYHQYQSPFGLARTAEEIEHYSADLSAVWATSAYLLPSAWTFEPAPEGELYPGATIAAIVALALLVGARRTGSRRRAIVQACLLGLGAASLAVAVHAWWIGGWAFQVAGLRVSLTHVERPLVLAACLLIVGLCWNLRPVQLWRQRSPFLFYSAAAALMLLFALGPRARLFGTTFLEPAPYALLMELPGGDAFRVPARFGMLFALCLAVAAALALKRLAPRRIQPVALAAICGAVAAEGFIVDMHVERVPGPLGAGGVERGAVVLELPMTNEVFSDLSDTAGMLRATYTDYQLVNGFSGYTPPHYPILKAGLARLDESVLRALQRFGSFLVFVHDDPDLGERYETLLTELPDAQRVVSGPSGTLFRLPGRNPEPLAEARLLPIGFVRASAGEGGVPNLTDGDITTRWHTPAGQVAGETITIDLEAAATITRLELDLGGFPADYPRRLRISTPAGEEGEAEVSWEGRTAGVAMLGALEDPTRVPMVFELGRPVESRQVVLSILENDGDAVWTIVELRVFGR
jgi:hypothetical protein